MEKKLPTQEQKRIEMPKTLDDFNKVRKTIISIMSSPHCDQFMFLSLQEKLTNVDKKIKELTPPTSINPSDI